MNQNTTKNAIAVMQAHVDGKKIQVQTDFTGPWTDDIYPVWDWRNNDYRVKPEPRTFWLYIKKTGILGDFCCPAGFEIQYKQISDFDDRVWEEIHVQEVLEDED